MQRERKFRAWDTVGKVMLDWNTLMQTAWNEGEMPLMWRLFSKGNLIPMDYTGLTDKNSQMIYEGDVIHYKEIIPSTTEAQRILQGADAVYLDYIGVVVWDHEGASFDVDGGENYRGFGARGECEYEVIGNIYENPELLTPTE